MKTMPYFADNSYDRRERPSRDALVRSYRERDALRARDARARSQDVIATRRPLDPNQRQPLSTQESHDLTQMSREAYEEARARRDVRMAQVQGRTSNRELIDGRGSIDSRAFNEKNELVGYSIDKKDKPDPLVDAIDANSRWSSRGRQGFGSGDVEGGPRRARRTHRRQDLDTLSDAISGHAQYGSRKAQGGLPKVAILLMVLIVVLLIVLAVILFG